MVTFAFGVFLVCAAINRWLVSRSVSNRSVEQKAHIGEPKAVVFYHCSCPNAVIGCYVQAFCAP
jgi:hypothetical protein